MCYFLIISQFPFLFTTSSIILILILRFIRFVPIRWLFSRFTFHSLIICIYINRLYFILLYILYFLFLGSARRNSRLSSSPKGFLLIFKYVFCVIQQPGHLYYSNCKNSLKFLFIYFLNNF